MDTVACIVGDSAVRLWGLTGVERLARQLRVIGLTPIAADAIPPGVQRVLLVRADHLFDERTLRDLAQRDATLLCIGAPHTARTAVAAVVPLSQVAAARAVLFGDASPESLPELAIETPGMLSAAYVGALLKAQPPAVVAVTPGRVAGLERLLFDGAYKGVTDLVTKWVWPAPACRATALCAKLGISPNAVTATSLVLVLLVMWLFAAGWFGSGLICAWAMTFLDTVDGKLARVTVTSTRFGHLFDHLIDLIHPPLWYVAWAYGAAGSSAAFAAVTPVLIVMLAGYVSGRLIEAAFEFWLARFSLFTWRPFDSYFRLIVARRNINLLSSDGLRPWWPSDAGVDCCKSLDRGFLSRVGRPSALRAGGTRPGRCAPPLARRYRCRSRARVRATLRPGQRSHGPFPRVTRTLPASAAHTTRTAPESAAGVPRLAGEMPRNRALRVGLLSNPSSGQNARHGLLAQVRSLLARHPVLGAFEAESFSDMTAAIDQLVEREADIVVINGGDGTVRAALTALLRAPLERVPLLAILPGGSTNTTARNLGFGRRALPALQNLLSSAAAGRLPGVVEPRPVLRVDSGDDAQYAMCFGAGAVYHGIVFARRSLESRGMRGNTGAGLALATFLARILSGNGGALFPPLHAAVRLDGAAVPEKTYFGILASTMDRQILGIHPFWGTGPAPVRYSSLRYRPQRLARALIPALRGIASPVLQPELGYRSANVAEVWLRIDSGFTLDGELFAAHAGTVEVRLTAGQTAYFLRARR